MTDLHKYLEGLKGYGTWFGPAHEKDCPADDTCECRGKPFNAAVNGIINDLSETIPTLTMDQEIEQTGIAADALLGESERLARPLIFCEHDAEAVFCLACDAVLQTEDAPRITRAKHNLARHQSDQCIYIALREAAGGEK